MNHRLTDKNVGQAVILCYGVSGRSCWQQIISGTSVAVKAGIDFLKAGNCIAAGGFSAICEE